MAAEPAHILVIDDNEEILQSLLLMLERKAYKVSIKKRLHNFEEEVKGLRPNLILLDKMLGWADGCDLCKTLKTDPDLSQIPIIMFSAYYKRKDECLEAGADSFLEKPFEMTELLRIIRSFTEQAIS